MSKPANNREIARRRDDALRRAMNTPPTPHKSSVKMKPSPAKRTSGKGRVRVGKSRS